MSIKDFVKKSGVNTDGLRIAKNWAAGEVKKTLVEIVKDVKPSVGLEMQQGNTENAKDISKALDMLEKASKLFGKVSY